MDVTYYTQKQVDDLLKEERQHFAREAARKQAMAMAEADEKIARGLELTNAQVDAAKQAADEARAWAHEEVAASRKAAEKAAESARREAQKQIDAFKEARADSYRMGISGAEQCGAEAPSVVRDGESVRCQREPGHPLGPYDRHKAVFGAPHEAVIWNEE